MDIVCTKCSYYMIEGVEFQEIISHNDDRGFFREIIRYDNQFVDGGIKQISHSLVYTGVIKAWHLHKVQTQWNYVLNGLIFTALHDLRKDSKTFGKTISFLTGDNQKPIAYKFPPGVAHGYKCINGPMNILYMTSGIYDISDELRIEFDNEEIGFNWINIPKIR